MYQLDHLDDLAKAIRAGARGAIDATRPLSTGEALYVALASNCASLLKERGYTITQALARIGPDWTAELTRRWQHA